MCRLTKNTTTTTNTKTLSRSNSNVRVLFTLKSFESSDDENTKNGSRYDIPNFASCFVTGCIIIVGLLGAEFALRYVFEQNQQWHPLLENETNRQILARHLGVDTLSCLICVVLGLLARDLCMDVLNLFVPKSNNHKGKDDADDKKSKLVALHPADYGERLFSFHPSAFRLSLFFFCYQVKNTYDTIIWGDGPEFIFHHIFSMFTSLGSMVPGCGHMYCVFFFGISEISTAVLCVLANFDDDHGVVGLGEALPLTRASLGGIFAVCFIVCRVLLWPVFAYYFVSDVTRSLRQSDPRATSRGFWMKYFLISVTSLSVLQVAWLGQIVILGKQELEKVGLL